MVKNRSKPQETIRMLLSNSLPKENSQLMHLITTPVTLRKRGEAHPQSKLNDAEVEAVRQMLMAGSSQRYIAEQFGVSQSLVKRIKAGQRKKSVPPSTQGDMVISEEAPSFMFPEVPLKKK